MDTRWGDQCLFDAQVHVRGPTVVLRNLVYCGLVRQGENTNLLRRNRMLE